MTAVHDMPFGAAVTQTGTRFRLWAPTAQQVELVLDDGQARPMDLEPGGWYSLTVPETGDGTAYRYRIDGDLLVPDPAARAQADDVHGPSLVVDPASFPWRASTWTGRPWEETVLYEVHVGTATPEATFTGLRARLPDLKATGITALELMPVADFPGRRNWGYDGVLPYAPDRSYGTPAELKQLVDRAHELGLMVFLDVVYNHFGPDGNYLHAYAGDFFDRNAATPWGEAIDMRQRPVRDFFIHNALYWLTEFQMDGLRLDAVHAISALPSPDTEETFLDELARRVRAGVPAERQIHLVLENDANEARLLDRTGGRVRRYTAQWNDDLHHVMHRLTSGETDGYYGDYAEAPGKLLARCLAEGFAYQGEPSAHRDGERRGEPSADLPPQAFVGFLQNHDQVGNRAHGERISEAAPADAVIAATACYLLCPQIPLIWMGEDWAASSRFPFFCDFHGDLAEAVREGRRKEFARFKKFADPDARRAIPDPNDPATFEAARLDWSERGRAPHSERLALVRDLLALRREHIVPLIASGRPETASWFTDGAAAVRYAFPAGRLGLMVNLSDIAAELPAFDGRGRPLFETHDHIGPDRLPAYSCAVFLSPA